MAKDPYELGSVNFKTSLGGMRTRAAEKPKDFKGTFKQLLQYGSICRGLILVSLICAVAGAMFSLLGPGSLSQITDLIHEGMETGSFDMQAIQDTGLYLLACYLLSFVLTYGQSFAMVSASQTIGRRMRSDISQKVNRIPLSYFGASSFGDLISRTTNDVDTIIDALRMALPDMVSAIVLFIGASVFMLRTNVTLALTAIGTSLIGFLLTSTIIRHSQKYFTNTSYYLGAIDGHIEEIYAAHLLVKTNGAEEENQKEFTRLNELLYENSWKSQFYGGILMPLMQFISNLGFVAVCVVGALLAEKGEISFGVIVAFIAYVKLFTQPLSQLAQAITNMQSCAAAAERVFAFLATPEMDPETGKKNDFVPTKGAVSFDHINFGYVPGRPVIQDFTIDIQPGQNVAIVGPTGAGKTTLVNLLMRFYELDSGHIRIDGQDTREITRENVHNIFSMVLQDTWTFEDTTRNNIAYANPDVSDEEIEEACRTVGMDHFIRSLPEGFDTVLKDDTNLSVGQKQLLTIARAIVAKKSLLILDEATSSVDTRTEQLVQNAIDKLMHGRTSFTIAHRLSTIRNADLILVMKDGQIVEQGRHEELLAKGGFYAQLWQSQYVKAETI